MPGEAIQSDGSISMAVECVLRVTLVTAVETVCIPMLNVSLLLLPVLLDATLLPGNVIRVLPGILAAVTIVFTLIHSVKKSLLNAPTEVATPALGSVNALQAISVVIVRRVCIRILSVNKPLPPPVLLDAMPVLDSVIL